MWITLQEEREERQEAGEAEESGEVECVVAGTYDNISQDGYSRTFVRLRRYIMLILPVYYQYIIDILSIYYPHITIILFFLIFSEIFWHNIILLGWVTKNIFVICRTKYYAHIMLYYA